VESEKNNFTNVCYYSVKNLVISSTIFQNFKSLRYSRPAALENLDGKCLMSEIFGKLLRVSKRQSESVGQCMLKKDELQREDACFKLD